MERKPWSESELETISINNGKLSHRQIGRLLGRSRAAIQKKAGEMGLTANDGNYEATVRLLDVLFANSEYERKYRKFPWTPRT